MRKFSLLLSLVLLIASCSSYTIANGRANIVLPTVTDLPETKLNADRKESSEASALFLYLGNDKIDNTTATSMISSIHEIAPDVIVLLGSKENQNLLKDCYKSVYELENTTIILSDRPFNTDAIELYIEDYPAILAQTELPILPLE